MASESDWPTAGTETRLRVMLDSAAEGIYALDLNGCCTYCNAACVRLLGYQRKADVLGENMHQLIHHTRKDGSTYPWTECRVYEAFLKNKELHVDDEILWRADGSSFDAEYWSYPIWEDGRVTGSVVTVLDITERKRVESILQANENRFLSVVRNSPFPTIIYAEDGEIIELSQSLLDITGYRREQLRTIEDWAALADGEGRGRVHLDVNLLSQLEGRHHDGEQVVTTRHGERRVWDFCSASLPALDDGRRLIVSKAMDVTERNRNAHAVRDLERLTRQVIESLPQLVWTCRPNGSCDYLSRQWIEYTGVPVANHLGEGWVEAIHPDDRDRARASWGEAVSNGHKLDIEYRLQRFDGSYRWFRALARPLRHENGDIEKWFGSCTDIEETKRHSEEVHRLNATLRHRVEEQTHDLREALRSVQSHAAWMHVLNDAALAMQSPQSLELLLQIVADQARNLVGARQAVTSFAHKSDGSDAVRRSSMPGEDAVLRYSNTLPSRAGLSAQVCQTNRPLRMTKRALEAVPQWQGASRERESRSPVESWLAVPLVDSQGANLGLIEVSDRYNGSFTEDDEASLIQLSRLAAAAIENTRLYEETANAYRILESTNRTLDADRMLIDAIHRSEAMFIMEESGSNFFKGLLDNLLELTRSEYGFIDELFHTEDGKPYLLARAITDISWSDETRKLYDQFIGGEVAFTNMESLYGEVSHSGKPVIANKAPSDPRRCGTPEGHPPLKSFLGLPLYSGHVMVGMIGLANCEGGYDEGTVDYLRPMLTACGNLLSAWRIDQHRKTAERQLRQANDQLAVQAEQLRIANSELESFSYSVSHDLRAPLRGIDSFSRIILEDYGARLDEEGHRLLNVVRGETQRMGHLIDDLLQFSRTGRHVLDPSAIDMTALARRVYDDLPAESRRHVHAFELTTLPAAFGDRAMLRQVWTNLLSNAVKFTGRNQDAHIEVGGSATDDFHVYHVRDNGVGFDPRFTHQLFGVFQRLHAEDEFEGTGVGLAIVQRVIHRHAGKVWAEGSLDRGATFYFSLPKPKDSSHGRD